MKIKCNRLYLSAIDRVISIVFVTLAVVALIGGGAFAQPSVFPTGVTKYDPARAYNSFIIFGGPDSKSHLINMDGEEVHVWNYAGFPSEILDPAITGGKRGHILVQLSGKNTHGPKAFGNFFNNKEIGELDWDGNIVWRWGRDAPGGAANQNHDWNRLPNGNTLVVTTLVHSVPHFKAKKVDDQVIYEVTPKGKIVWKWVVSEHLKEFGFSKAGLKMIYAGYTTTGGSAGFLTINNMQPLGPNHWYDNGDKRFNPDNIMIDSRDGNVIAIIDKKTGHFVWRSGPYYPGNEKSPYGRIFNSKVPRPVDQISGQHDVHMIPKGLPGAGDILVFDNQGSAGFPPAYLGTFPGSRVLEINPVTMEIVWQYTGTNSNRDVWTFFSSFVSSARRLPNGNTLICEGMNGRFFQITPKGEIVWEYINPNFIENSQGARRF